MKIILILVLFLTLLMSASNAFAVAYESITVADTAIGFTGATLTGHSSAFCTSETAEVRFRFDAVPTNTTGHVLSAGSSIRFNNKELGVKFIRTGAVSATINCTYE